MTQFLKALSVKLFIIVLLFSNTALSAHAVLIYRDFNHKGDENQVRGVVQAYSNLVGHVEVKEFNVGQEEELKSAIKMSDTKPIVIAVGEKTVDSFAQLLPLEGATTIHLCHMVTSNHPTLLGKVDYLALPGHAVGDFAKDEKKTQLIQTTGVSHNRQIAVVESTYQEEKDKLPSSKAYLGVILAGDAPTPQNEMRLFTKKNASALAQYVSSIMADNHLLIINGPRTGKYNPQTLEEIKTAHRDGQPDAVTQAFVDELKNKGIKPEQFTLFDFQFGKSTSKDMDLVLGAVRATNSMILVPGESTSSISESIDTCSVVVYPNTAMNDIHTAHVNSELEAGRIKLLSSDFQKISEPKKHDNKLPTKSAAETIAYVLSQR